MIPLDATKTLSVKLKKKKKCSGQHVQCVMENPSLESQPLALTHGTAPGPQPSKCPVAFLRLLTPPGQKQSQHPPLGRKLAISFQVKSWGRMCSTTTSDEKDELQNIDRPQEEKMLLFFFFFFFYEHKFSSLIPRRLVKNANKTVVSI